MNYLTAMDVYSAFPFVRALTENDEERRKVEVKKLFELHCSEHGAPRRILTDGAESSMPLLRCLDVSHQRIIQLLMASWSVSIVIWRTCVGCKATFRIG